MNNIGIFFYFDSSLIYRQNKKVNYLSYLQINFAIFITLFVKLTLMMQIVQCVIDKLFKTTLEAINLIWACFGGCAGTCNFLYYLHSVALKSCNKRKNVIRDEMSHNIT